MTRTDEPGQPGQDDEGAQLQGTGLHGSGPYGTEPRRAGLHGTTLELSHDEYRTAWHALGLGMRHWNMELPGLPEMTDEERQTRAGRTVEGLRARGLADGRQLAPAVAEPLRVLARPVREVNGWIQQGEYRVRLLAGSRGDTGVLALLDARRLVVHTGPAGGMCAAVVRLLPDREAGRGSSVSVLAELLQQPVDGNGGLSGARLEDRLVQGGTKPETARGFVAMIRGRRHAVAKFGAARRDRDGTRRPAPGVLAYLAADSGAYTLQPSRGPDGTAWTTLAPASTTQVEQRLAQLVDSAPAG